MDKNKSLENSWKVVPWNFASNSHLYFLSQLKYAKVPANDLLSLYTTCICPVARYACPVFDTALPQYLSNQLEHQQK